MIVEVPITHAQGSTFKVKRTAAYPQARYDAGATRVVCHAGGVLLAKTGW